MRINDCDWQAAAVWWMVWGWGLGFLRPLRGGGGVGVDDYGLREAQGGLASPVAPRLDPRPPLGGRPGLSGVGGAGLARGCARKWGIWVVGT